MHLALGELQLQLQHELVDDARNHRRRQVAERYDRIQAVAELRREHALDRFLVLADAGGRSKADALARHVARARVRRHDQEDRKKHTSELQSLMRISYAVFCLKKKKKKRI